MRDGESDARADDRRHERSDREFEEVARREHGGRADGEERERADEGGDDEEAGTRTHATIAQVAHEKADDDGRDDRDGEPRRVVRVILHDDALSSRSNPIRQEADRPIHDTPSVAKPAKPPTALERYARKRDFSKTPEPSGAAAARTSTKRLRFVVQKHRATRLHYDFRLEADGVLKSWAIPKGPSFDPHDKRLAMHVEDHPLDYRDFEGVIPDGNYGAGEVIVWDEGTYRLIEGTDPTAQIASGSLKFEMRGKKLHGAFALVRIKGRDGEENAWLLVKERDDAVDPTWRIDDHAASVKTGKSLADIAAERHPATWTSPEAAARGPRAKAASAEIEPVPTLAGPMLATPVDAPFDGDDWLFELKWDGYRALVTIDREGVVSIVSRNGNDFTKKFEELAGLASAFRERPVVVDGEIVVLDDEGRPSFAALQERLDRFGRRGEKRRDVTFVAFDLPYGNGRDLRAEPLETRKAALEALLTGEGPAMFSKHVVRDGIKLFELAGSRDLEGIVAKKRASTYVSRRSADWLKIKRLARQEFVVGGWTEGRGGREHFGALLVGTYEDGELAYAGSVGTGFDRRKLTAIAKKLEPLARATSPFATKPKTDAPAHWVAPTLVAEVTFAEWTRDGQLRQPVFVALREDRDAREIVRERARRAPRS